MINNIADSLNVNGFAENLGDGSVKVLCEGKEEIVTEIRTLREDLGSYMEEKFARIEHEIEGIKAKIGMV